MSAVAAPFVRHQRVDLRFCQQRRQVGFSLPMRQLSIEFARAFRRHVMLSKVFAVWIVVLIVLPFTAPLSSVSLEGLWPKPGHHDGPATSSLPAAGVRPLASAHAGSMPVPNGRFLTRQHAPRIVGGAPIQDRTHRCVSRPSDSFSAALPAVLRI
jgi:hypothetical protein